MLRYEVTEILPDETISDAMDRQAQAERIRREKVLQASGDKESQILRSQGDLEARTNEALAYKVCPPMMIFCVVINVVCLGRVGTARERSCKCNVVRS